MVLSDRPCSYAGSKVQSGEFKLSTMFHHLKELFPEFEYEQKTLTRQKVSGQLRLRGDEMTVVI